MKAWPTIVVAALGVCGAARGEPISVKDGCRTNPAIVAPCFELWGRAFASNGTPSLRIRVDKTKRILGVLPAESEIAPACLRSNVKFEQDVTGRFTVCPFSLEKPRAMQLVCVEDVASAEVRRKNKASRHTSLQPISNCEPVLSNVAPPGAYELLASHHSLHGARVGIAHADGSPEALAFRDLLWHPLARRWFRSLTTEVKLGARLYGLCGLRFVLPEQYEQGIARYNDSEEALYVEDSDWSAQLRVRDLFIKGRNPFGSFSRFCDELAGRSR
jgi:hypothetical protein